MKKPTNEKKQVKMNKKVVAGVLICGGLLASGVGAYSFFYPTTSQTEPTNKAEPIIKKKKSEEPIIKRKKQADSSLPKAFKEATEDSSVDGFRNPTVSTNTIDNEKKSALSQLVAQIEATPTTTPLIEKPQGAVTSTTPVTSTNPTVKPDIPLQKPEQPVEPPIIIPPIVTEVDYIALVTLVQQCEQVDLSLYLSKSTSSFKTELLIAQRMIEELVSTQEAVNNQIIRLTEARNQLAVKGNKNQLQKVYDTSLTLQLDIFTTESIQLFNEAQQKAKAVLDSVEETQETIDSTMVELQQGIDQLKEKEEPFLSLAYLQRVVLQAKTINQEDYTPETSQLLQQKLIEVESYLSSENYTKERNEIYQNELQQAIDQLQKKANLTEINVLIVTANSIDRALYTDESLAVLDVKLASATAIVSANNSTQQEVDQVAIELSQSIQELQSK